MSVTAVRPFANLSGGVNSEGNHEYVNVYHVYTDDIDDAADTARGSSAVSAGLPDYKASWSWGNDSNAFALAQSRMAELVETDEAQPYYKKWRVTINYTTAGDPRDSSGGGGSGSGSREGIQDPTDEQWRISGSYVQTTERTSVDRHGERITNSAEEEVLADVPSGYDTLILSGNTSTIDLVVRAAAIGKCSEKPMWGLEKRQVFLSQWAYEVKYKASTAYVAHRLEWWIAPPKDPDTEEGLWNFVYLDQGTREKVSDLEDPKLRYKPILVRDVPASLPLDLNGRILNLDTFPEGKLIAKEVIDEYDFLAKMTFLPNPIPGPFS